MEVPEVKLRIAGSCATALILIVLAQPSAADVVVLKSGTRVSGTVVDKGTHYQVTVDAVLRTYPKDEVERVIGSPGELLGDAPDRFEKARQEFYSALAAGRALDDHALRSCADHAAAARDAYAQARELFPEEAYADLDEKLVRIMQLLRLVRERMTSRIAAAPEAAPAPGASLEEALVIVRDPSRRSDPAERRRAGEALRAGTDETGRAASLFLSRTDAEWRLQGESLRALQEYFARPPATRPEEHLAATKWIVDRIAAARRADPSAAVEALALFGAAHVGCSPGGRDREKLAAQLGLVADERETGSPEGRVVCDLGRWIRGGEPELAVLAWLKEFRSIDTPNVRYVWAVALMRLAVRRGRGFDRAISAMQGIKQPPAELAAHLAAMIRSIRAVAPCETCAGEGRLRCTNCHGRKEIRFTCRACEGTGKMRKSNGFVLENCPPCRNSGTEKIIRCTHCKDGYRDCVRCDAPRKAAAESEICTSAPCAPCGGTGSALSSVRWTCPSCRGLGEILTPRK
jgi:hypothetical protein